MRDRTTQRKATETIDVPAKAAPEPAAANQLSDLQRVAGNAAVVAMLAEHDPVIQPKLEVGAVHDPAEAEADKLADQVLRNLASGGAAEPPAAPVARISRSARGGDASGSPGHGAEGGPVDGGVATRIESARGGGAPLEPGLRGEMEAGFGADFGGVRVHTGGESENLNRSLNAQAFTTGSDIFFSGAAASDKRIVAHELAHTVQQGSSPQVNRFVSATEFNAMTNQGTFTMRGDAQKKIEKYLNEYYALIGLPQTAGLVSAPSASMLPAKLPAALNLLKLMKLAADGWMAAHKGPDGQVKADRAKRGEGMEKFLTAVTVEIEAIKNKKALDEMAGQAGAGATPEDELATKSTKFETRSGKIKQKANASLTDGFSIAEKAVGALVTHDGDSTDFILDLTVPVGGPGYVSITLNFNIRKQGNIELGLNLLVGAGARFPGVADLRGAIGGFIKASGTDAKATVDLAKYGIYRRLRESKAVPRGVASYLWGDKTDPEGYKKADDWSKEVERRHMGQEGSYVETGGMAEGKASVGAEDAAALGITVSKQIGQRYDKTSIDAAKGGKDADGKKTSGLGADNKRADGDANKTIEKDRGAQAKTGRNVETIRIAGTGTAGPWSGEIIVQWSYRYDPVGKSMESSAGEVQANFRCSLPVTDLASTIVSSVASLVSTIKSKAMSISKQAEAQGKKNGPKDPLQPLKTAAGFIVPTILTGNNVANAVSFDKAGVPWTQWAQGVTKESSAASATEGAKKLLSKVGLEIGFTVKGDVDTDVIGMVELRHVTSMDASLPELLKAKLTSKKRLGGANLVGSSWTPIA